MKYVILFFLLLISVSFAFPAPVGYVNDFAGILTDTQLLENELRLYEENTTVEIAVVTIDDIPEDQTLATYADELFQEWGIGKKGEDNGILVLVVKNGTIGKRMRIELGYIIQGYITGAEAGRILDDALPSYETGDYQSAVETIMIGLSDQLENYIPGVTVERSSSYSTLVTVFPAIIFGLIFVFIIIAAYFSGRCPYCKSRKIKIVDSDFTGYTYVCNNCHRKFKKRTASYFAAGGMAAGGFGHGGGGFGGFGGGGSGGGGAGR